MKTGITGASGQLGKLIVKKLIEKTGPSSVVALVRSPEKVQGLGIEVRKFDYEEAAGLASSLKDIDTLLLISANEIGKRERQHKNVINAAKSAGVKWIVYTSILHADTSSLSLAAEHLATENEIKKSGIPYTILRNSWYTENYTGSIQGAVAGGAFIGSAGDGKIASAVRSDFAEAAVAVLTGKDHKGKIYELAGDEAYTLKDLAAEISRQTGKNIPYNNLPESEYAGILQKFGLPEGIAAAIASWDKSASKGDLFDGTRQLSMLIGHPTAPLSVAVKEAVNNLH